MIAFLHDERDRGLVCALRDLLQSKDVPVEVLEINDETINQLAGSSRTLLIDGNSWDSNSRSLSALQIISRLRRQTPPFGGGAIVLSFLRLSDARSLPGGEILDLPGTLYCRLPVIGNELLDRLQSAKPLTEQERDSVRVHLDSKARSDYAERIAHNSRSKLGFLNTYLRAIRRLAQSPDPDIPAIEADLRVIRGWWDTGEADCVAFLENACALVNDSARQNSQTPQPKGAADGGPDNLVALIRSLAEWRFDETGGGATNGIEALRYITDQLLSAITMLWDNLTRLSK